MAEKQSPVKKVQQSPNKKLFVKTKTVNNIITHRIFTMGAQEGIVIVYIKHSMQDKAAFVHPIIKLLNTDESETERNKITNIVPRRMHPEDNIAMKMGSVQNGDFMCFVHILDNEEENSFETRALWGRSLTASFNLYGSTRFQYPCRFAWSGDYHASIAELPPLGFLILDDDTINIMLCVFSDIELKDLINNDTIISKFFGNQKIEYGKNKMFEKFTEIETEKLAEEFNNNFNNKTTTK